MFPLVALTAFLAFLAFVSYRMRGTGSSTGELFPSNALMMNIIKKLKTQEALLKELRKGLERNHPGRESNKAMKGQKGKLMKCLAEIKRLSRRFSKLLNTMRTNENNPFHPLNGLSAKKLQLACLGLIRADDAMAAASGEISLARGASQEMVDAIIARMNVGGDDLEDARECCQFYTDLSFIKKAIDVLAEKGAKANQEKVQTFLEKLVSLEMDDSDGRAQIMKLVGEVFDTTPTCNFKHIVSTTPTVRPRTAAIVALKDGLVNLVGRLTGLCDKPPFKGVTYLNSMGFLQRTEAERQLATSIEERMRHLGCKVPSEFAHQKELDVLNDKKERTSEEEQRLVRLITERNTHYEDITSIVRQVTGMKKCVLLKCNNGHLYFDVDEASVDDSGLPLVPTMVVLPFWFQDLLNRWCKHTGQQPVVKTIDVSTKSGPGISHAYVTVMDGGLFNNLPKCIQLELKKHFIVPTKYLLKFPDVEKPLCTWKTVGSPSPIDMLSQLVPPATDLEMGKSIPTGYNPMSSVLTTPQNLLVVSRIINRCNKGDAPKELSVLALGLCDQHTI